jgi:L-malate glycosyltransferase
MKSRRTTSKHSQHSGMVRSVRGRGSARDAPPLHTKEIIKPIFITAPAPPPPREQRSQLRILVVFDQFYIGGTETYALSVVRHMLRQGHHVVVTAKTGHMLGSFQGLGCPVYCIDFVDDSFEKNSMEQDSILLKLGRIIISEKIQIVNIHQSPSGEFGIDAAVPLNVPVVFTLHGTYIASDFIRQYLPRCSAIVAVSPAAREWIHAVKVPVHLIPNGVDLEEYKQVPRCLEPNLREELGISEKDRLLLYAGRLSWEKADACRTLIDIAAQLRKQGIPDLQVVIVGSGAHSAELSERVELLNGEAINVMFIWLAIQRRCDPCMPRPIV